MLSRWSKQIEQSYKNCREKYAGFKVKDKFPVNDPQNSPLCQMLLLVWTVPIKAEGGSRVKQL